MTVVVTVGGIAIGPSLYARYAVGQADIDRVQSSGQAVRWYCSGLVVVLPFEAGG